MEAKTLKTISLFKNVEERGLEEIVAVLEKKELKANEVLFNVNDPGAELYIVESGEVSIFIPTKAGSAEGEAIRTFCDGDVLGEMAILDNQPRSASARADRDSVVYALKKDKVDALISENDEFAFSIIGGLNDRIRYTTDFIGELRKWMSRIAEGDYETQDFVDGETEDDSLSSLAEGFVRMASAVKEREEELKKELVRLQVIIDQDKRKQDVSEIAESDFFRKLREQKEKQKGEGEG